jgi:hypothetical protein
MLETSFRALHFYFTLSTVPRLLFSLIFKSLEIPWFHPGAREKGEQLVIKGISKQCSLSITLDFQHQKHR